MRSRSVLSRLVVAVALLAGTASLAQARPRAGPGPEVWLSPKPVDFVPIIEGSAPAAPWETVAGQVDVLTVTQGFVRHQPPEVLQRLVEDLKRRHIALGIGILPINWFHETPCGQGIEGYSDPASARDAVAKLKAAGARVAFIGMDEPLWFGHYYSGKNACRSSLDNLTQRNAALVKIFTSAFPEAAVVDVEPFPAVSSQPDWAGDYAAWLKAFQAAVGTPITALQADFNWGDPRLNPGNAHDGSNAAAVGALAREVVGVAHRNGLRAGMIYWGGQAANTTWMGEARLHIREVKAADAGFDQAIFTSWNPAPTHTFPATDPTALASLIPYFERSSH